MRRRTQSPDCLFAWGDSNCIRTVRAPSPLPTALHPVPPWMTLGHHTAPPARGGSRLTALCAAPATQGRQTISIISSILLLDDDTLLRYGGWAASGTRHPGSRHLSTRHLGWPPSPSPSPAPYTNRHDSEAGVACVARRSTRSVAFTWVPQPGWLKLALRRVPPGARQSLPCPVFGPSAQCQSATAHPVACPAPTHAPPSSRARPDKPAYALLQARDGRNLRLLDARPGTTHILPHN